MEEAEKGDYFKVMIWSEGGQKDMVMPIDNSFRFDLHFGRMIDAKLLKHCTWRRSAVPSIPTAILPESRHSYIPNEPKYTAKAMDPSP